MSTAAQLESALRAEGLTVQTIDGWETRGGTWAQAGKPLGVMHHHTAAPVPFPLDNLSGKTSGLIKCNINTKPDGTVWLVAYEACNYSSGTGSNVVLNEVKAKTPPSENASTRGLADDTGGNSWFWNFENDHLGNGSPLPEVQFEAIVASTEVVCDHFDIDQRQVISHAEWTARKYDPYWNGDKRAIEAIREALEEHPMHLKVKELQQALKKAGLYEGEVTNVYDDATKAALEKAFTKARTGRKLSVRIRDYLKGTPGG